MNVQHQQVMMFLSLNSWAALVPHTMASIGFPEGAVRYEGS